MKINWIILLLVVKIFISVSIRLLRNNKLVICVYFFFFFVFFYGKKSVTYYDVTIFCWVLHDNYIMSNDSDKKKKKLLLFIFFLEQINPTIIVFIYRFTKIQTHLRNGTCEERIPKGLFYPRLLVILFIIFIFIIFFI